MHTNVLCLQPVCVCSGANHESVEPAMLEVRKLIHSLDLIAYTSLLTMSHRLPLPAWRQYKQTIKFSDLSQYTHPVCLQPTTLVPSHCSHFGQHTTPVRLMSLG